jgi:hypothetical protein
MMNHDQLIEQGLCDLLRLQSFDEIANGTRSRVLRKDKAKRIAREIIAALNKARSTPTRCNCPLMKGANNERMRRLS